MRGSRRVLLVQLADLGDLMLAGPAITHLRHTHPEDRFTLLTKPSNEALASHLADDLLLADKNLFDDPFSILRPRALTVLARLGWKLRRARYEEVIIFHHLVTRWGRLKFAALALATGAPVRRGLDNGHGWFLTDAVTDRGFGARHEAGYFGALSKGTEPVPLHVDREAARRLLHDKEVRGAFVLMHPGSGTYSTARRWPLEFFGEVADQLWHERRLRTVVVGGAGEEALAAKLVAGRDGWTSSVAGMTELPALAGLLSESILFVGNDGGVAQLAFLLCRPSVVIYGPTSPATWGPQSANARAVMLDLPCSPCFYRFKDLGTPKGCATRECLWSLRPDQVLEAIADVLSEQRAA